MIFLHRGVDRAQFGAGLVESDAGSEVAEKFGHAMDAARDHGGGKVVRTGDDVGDDFSVGGIRDARLKDADDGGGAVADAAEANGLADHIGSFL